MRIAVVCLSAALALSACGKKGNPLPPLVRIPVAPTDFAVTRVDEQVYVRLTTPATNVDGERPADVARVEIYAITLEGPPPDLTRIDLEDLRASSTLVGSEAVRRPQPPPPPPPEDGGKPLPVPPAPPGVDQGSGVIVIETLQPESRVVTSLDTPAREQLTDEPLIVPGPLVSPASSRGPQRFYYAVGVSPRGRYGPPTALIPVPLGPPSGPPSAPRITVTETAMELSWSPPVDVRGAVTAGDPEWLPARPIVPGPPPTTYDVYEVAREAAADQAPAVPQALTPEPIAELSFTQTPITLGGERCFVVRAVDVIDGVHVRGPASPVACASFADTFAPSGASDLVAVAVGGGINLIWDPSESGDVAGYVVLRGEAGGDTLAPLNEELVTTPSYRDEAVKPGVRYVYAVVAVDRAGNRSAESNRVEESAQ